MWCHEDSRNFLTLDIITSFVVVVAVVLHPHGGILTITMMKPIYETIAILQASRVAIG